MRFIFSALLGACFAVSFTSTGVAQTARSVEGQPAVLVELYTSQGCSSCPPADAVLAMLATNPAIVALALHVDYWDYIGWKDEFAVPSHTSRQRAYAKVKGNRAIYTPQFVIGGVDFVEGTNPGSIKSLVKAHMAGSSPVTMTIVRTGNRLTIRAIANPPLGRRSQVQLVRYTPSQSVDIRRGENAGRTISYTNIVTSWQVLADWPGQAPLELEAAVTGGDPIVVIIQSEGPRAVLAAALID